MSNKLKLIVGIVLIIAMIPVMGVMTVKDNLRNNSYCASCHEEYYASWENPESEYSLTHVHNQMGVSCQTCHQRGLEESVAEVGNFIIGNYYSPLPESTVPMENCFACHESYEKITPLTTVEITGKEFNPHEGHWGEMECSECHKGHRNSVVSCDECHAPFMEDAPGWTAFIIE